MYPIFLAFVALSSVHVYGLAAAPAKGRVPEDIPPAELGVIPVFVKPADTPLEEINPDLAKAFLYYDIKHGRYVQPYQIKSEGIWRAKLPATVEELNELLQRNEVILPKKPNRKTTTTTTTTTRKPPLFSHVQRIPIPRITRV